MLTPSLPKAQCYENEDFDQIIVGKFSIYLGSGLPYFVLCVSVYLNIRVGLKSLFTLAVNDSWVIGISAQERSQRVKNRVILLQKERTIINYCILFLFIFISVLSVHFQGDDYLSSP